MFMVVIGTFAWPTLKMLNKIPKSDAFVVVSVTLITAFSHNLALAVVS
jgi:SulP family sulfate permease